MRLRASLIALLLSIIVLSVSAQDSTFTIAPNTSVEGNLTNSFFNQRYRVTLSAGLETTITMETIDGDLDPYLFLFNETEQLIADNDDFEDGNRSARITFTPETNATFIIEATRYQQETGITTGRYRLAVTIAGSETTAPDPLTIPPNFGVVANPIAYETPLSATLDATTTRQYYALGGRQGEFIRMVIVNPDTLNLTVNLLNPNLTVISRLAQSTPQQKIIYAVIPQTGWYLIEVVRQDGAGEFTLNASLVSNTVLAPDTPIEARFESDTQTLSYIFNATINERVFVNMTVLEGTGIVPEISIIDLGQETLAQRDSQGTQTRVNLTIPRSGPYIVQAHNAGTGDEATFRLEMRRTEADISKLTIETATYNNDYSGTITDDAPIEYYRFSGKAGELVTVEMRPVEGTDTTLDPYLILADSQLNELTFNDNAGATRSARIAQFPLPADGDYFILASRTGLARGVTVGDYTMAITVGRIALETGILNVTLTWQGDADLNLFVRTPELGTISWAYPRTPDNGQLQIDSNTSCQTLTTTPVEHIYWDDDVIPSGDYTVWVWYQNVCSVAQPVPFTLTINNGNLNILTVTSTEQAPNQISPLARFEASIRMSDTGTATLLNSGTTTTPSAQQTASQGGDTLIVYGQTVTGTITDDVYAQFYQFTGNAGDNVTITVERVTGTLDPIVVLRNALDTNLAQNDDISASDNNAQVTFTLPDNGRYVVAVTRYGLRDGTTTGDYRLTVRR